MSAVLTGSQDPHIMNRGALKFVGTWLSKEQASLHDTSNPSSTLTHQPSIYTLSDGRNEIWGTDIEIVALSSMLGVDIFVSNFHSSSQDRSGGSSSF